MTRWLIAIAAGVVLGLGTHIAALLMVPALAADPAIRQIAALGAANAFHPLAAAGSRPVVPFLDPQFRYLACPFALGTAPLHIHSEVAGGYTALSFYGPDGVPFFSLNDRSAENGALDVELRGPATGANADEGDSDTVVTAPSSRGVVLLAVLLASPSNADAVAAALAHASCDAPAPAPSDAPDDDQPAVALPPLPVAPPGRQ